MLLAEQVMVMVPSSVEERRVFPAIKVIKGEFGGFDFVTQFPWGAFTPQCFTTSELCFLHPEVAKRGCPSGPILAKE